MIEALSLHADADDIMPDSSRSLVYVSCGAGYVDVFNWEANASLRPLAQIPTAPGSRTCLLDRETHRLYVAVPHRGEQHAEILVYEATP